MISVKENGGCTDPADGCRTWVDFAEKCPGLERFHHVSTCYVSGRHAGIFRETDLDVGQVFNNFYEETKFLAEVDVQARMKSGLPATIYRPSVVVGDSETGATQKYDGPYFVIRWLLRQPVLAVLPVVGDPTAVCVNLVPRDFIIDAISHLSDLEESSGEVYQLADPSPLTVDRLIDLVAETTGRKVLRVPTLRSVAKASLDYLPGLQSLMQIPSAAIDYFAHPTFYATDNANRDLGSAGITVPRLEAYMHRLVSNPDILLQTVEAETYMSWFVYVVRLSDRFTQDDRDDIIDGLRRHDVGACNYFPPIPLLPYYQQKYGYRPGDFPVAESVSHRTVALPFYSRLTEREVDLICQTLDVMMTRITFSRS